MPDGDLIFCTAPEAAIHRAASLMQVRPENLHYAGPQNSRFNNSDFPFYSWGDGPLTGARFPACWVTLKRLAPGRILLPLNNHDGSGYSLLRLLCRMLSANAWEIPNNGEPHRITWSLALSGTELAWHSLVLKGLESASPLFRLLLKKHVPPIEPGPRAPMQVETLQDLYEDAPPEVSIIIRTCNEERYLAETLEMIQRQQGPGREVLVIDSGSTDRTVDIARSYPIRVYRIPKEAFHYSATLNLGAHLARGRFLAFLSAHSVPQTTDWLRHLVAPMQAEEQVAGVVGREVPIPGWASPFEQKLLADIFRDEPRVMTDSFFFSNANAAVRRERVLNTPFDEGIHWGEDQVWAHAMHRQGFTTVYRPESVVAHSHNLTMTDCFTRTLRFQRTLFARMHRECAETTHREFKSQLAERARSFRRYLAEHRLMSAPLSWVYAPWCEWMNFMGCEWAYREWKIHRTGETASACAAHPKEVLP